MAAACEAAGLIPVAVDGQSARAAKRDTATGCLHVVTAWAAENRLVLGAARVADGSNEIAAIPELLRTLDLAGAIVTIDAAGCQVEDARIIRQRKGHYLLAVKGNQPTLRAAVEGVFEQACATDFAGVRSEGHEEVDDGHGRHAERDVAVIHDPAGLPPGWPEPAAVVLVNRTREVGGERVHTSHYYITSHAGTAAELAGFIRGHWGIEIPQPEDPRSDSLSAVGRAGYHRGRRPVGVGRVERQKPSGPRRQLMLNSESTCVPPRPRFLRRAH